MDSFIINETNSIKNHHEMIDVIFSCSESTLQMSICTVQFSKKQLLYSNLNKACYYLYFFLWNISSICNGYIWFFVKQYWNKNHFTSKIKFHPEIKTILFEIKFSNFHIYLSESAIYGIFAVQLCLCLCVVLLEENPLILTVKRVYFRVKLEFHLYFLNVFFVPINLKMTKQISTMTLSVSLYVSILIAVIRFFIPHNCNFIDVFSFFQFMLNKAMLSDTWEYFLNVHFSFRSYIWSVQMKHVLHQTLYLFLLRRNVAKISPFAKCYLQDIPYRIWQYNHWFRFWYTDTVFITVSYSKWREQNEPSELVLKLIKPTEINLSK